MKLKRFFNHLNRRDTRLFPRLNPLAKFILVFAIISGSIFITKNIFAQNVGYGDLEINSDQTEFNEALLGKQEAIRESFNLETWNNEQIINTAFSLNNGIIGDVTQGDLASGNWVPGGLLGFTNNSIATLYQPPISGVQYIAHTIDNFLGKPTYAANGFGFDTLNANNNGIMSLWKTLRNAVYTLISLFFIILGIMIMLRVKISPQATISIQVIIPKIIITLILVTFSYAIVGLLIDFSYVFQGIVLSLIDNSDGPNTIANTITGYDVPKIMNLNFWGVQWITSKYFLTEASQGTLRSLGAIIGLIIGFFTGGGLFSKMTSSGIGAFLGLFLLDLIIFIQLVKLFFGLAKCYINILLKIVIAPLEIALGVFPGSKINFSSWIVQLIANLVVFPATLIFLVVIIIFVRAVAGDNSYFWAPNMLANGEVVGFIIGFTGIMLLSKIPQIVPEFLFNIKPSPINKMIGDSYASLPGMKTAKGGLERRAEDMIGGKAHDAWGRIKAPYNTWVNNRKIDKGEYVPRHSKSSTSPASPTPSTSSAPDSPKGKSRRT